MDKLDILQTREPISVAPDQWEEVLRTLSDYVLNANSNNYPHLYDIPLAVRTLVHGIRHMYGEDTVDPLSADKEADLLNAVRCVITYTGVDTTVTLHRLEDNLTRLELKRETRNQKKKNEFVGLLLEFLSHRIPWLIVGERLPAIQVSVAESTTSSTVGHTTASVTDVLSEPPWKRIDDYRWDRRALEMWCQGHSSREIAHRIGNLTAKTVMNRLSYLRRLHGEGIVPTDDQRRRRS